VVTITRRPSARTVALLGRNGVGKTSLLEALVVASGGLKRPRPRNNQLLASLVKASSSPSVTSNCWIPRRDIHSRLIRQSSRPSVGHSG
jgi:recombinational DNA repair ATPase RecF